MTVVASGYDLKPNELYETESWVGFRAIADIDVAGSKVWECAAGGHRLADVARLKGADVYTTDIAHYGRQHSAIGDFLSDGPHIIRDADMVFTNPPYGAQNKTAAKFVRRALGLCDGWVIMVLTMKFDSGSTRNDLFRNNSRFHSKIVLTDRISWENNGKGGTEDHAVFRWAPKKQPVIAPILIYRGRN